MALTDLRTPTDDDDELARELRGFGPLGLAAAAAILLGNALFVPLSAILVLWWVHRSRTPWRDIAYVAPRSWVRTVAGAVVFGCLFKIAMKSIVMPLFGAPPVNPAYHYLAGSTAALPGAIYAMTVGAGFGEETLFRGFLFERFGKLVGTAAGAKALTVLLVSIWFGAVHYAVQGVPGVQQATIVGLVFGTIVAVTGRIWVPMIAHAAFDLTALAMIYWDVESWFAHLVFK